MSKTFGVDGGWKCLMCGAYGWPGVYGDDHVCRDSLRRVVLKGEIVELESRLEGARLRLVSLDGGTYE